MSKYPAFTAFWSAYEMGRREAMHGTPLDPRRFRSTPRTYYDGDLRDAYQEGHEDGWKEASTSIESMFEEAD